MYPHYFHADILHSHCLCFEFTLTNGILYLSKFCMVSLLYVNTTGWLIVQWICFSPLLLMTPVDAFPLHHIAFSFLLKTNVSLAHFSLLFIFAVTHMPTHSFKILCLPVVCFGCSGGGPLQHSHRPAVVLVLPQAEVSEAGGAHRHFHSVLTTSQPEQARKTDHHHHHPWTLCYPLKYKREREDCHISRVICVRHEVVLCYFSHTGRENKPFPKV